MSKSRLFRTATLLFIVFFLTCCYSRGWLIAGIEPNACGQSENDFSKRSSGKRGAQHDDPYNLYKYFIFFRKNSIKNKFTYL